MATTGAAAGAEPDERDVAGLDAGLQLGRLRLGELAGGDRRVDLVGERLLERVRQLRRADAELAAASATIALLCAWGELLWVAATAAPPPAIAKSATAPAATDRL